ncbi:hypothetical protein FIBSPDRAFT_939063 [Athelia psychrophila]|uniref:Uncharacterized protein n=1 Tax=Athelia psychrophila TaxID=1759441 RepID=A0A165X968_9AGAM|nr:hypothetical protein FIBSPDRAFT_939063 [Fibularhizoctonia sp. CBS 109695]
MYANSSGKMCEFGPPGEFAQNGPPLPTSPRISKECLGAEGRDKLEAYHVTEKGIGNYMVPWIELVYLLTIGPGGNQQQAGTQGPDGTSGQKSNPMPRQRILETKRKRQERQESPR